jgi:hypothetical protein
MRKKIIEIVVTDTKQGIYVKRSDYYGIQAYNYRKSDMPQLHLLIVTYIPSFA